MDKKVGTRNLFNLALGAFVSWRCEARTKVVLSTTRLRLAIGKKSAQGLLHLPTADPRNPRWL